MHQINFPHGQLCKLCAHTAGGKRKLFERFCCKFTLLRHILGEYFIMPLPQWIIFFIPVNLTVCLILLLEEQKGLLMEGCFPGFKTWFCSPFSLLVTAFNSYAWPLELQVSDNAPNPIPILLSWSWVPAFPMALGNVRQSVQSALHH